jgi:alkylation response protein AidB-like acyl-CoA dehydrogenase
MQYQYTAEQTEFKDMLHRFVQDHYSYEARREYVKTELGYVANHWQQLAELGVLGLPFAEQYGGLEMDLGYQMAVAEEFGRGLVLEPFISCVALAAKLLAQSDSEDIKQSLLPTMVSGDITLALAWEERISRGEPERVLARARQVADGIVISGEKIAVLGAEHADCWLVSARDEREQLNVYLLDRQAIASGNVECIHYKTVDGHRASNIKFDHVTLSASACLYSAGASKALRQVLDETILVLAAEAVGAMDQLLEITVEYCKTRKQFGTPIGTFQVIQHRIADMLVATERVRSLMWATLQAAATEQESFSRAAAMLKAELGASGRYVGQQAVQLHGGIGMTDELNVGAYFKRLTAIELLFGNRDYHLERLGSKAAA